MSIKIDLVSTGVLAWGFPTEVTSLKMLPCRRASIGSYLRMSLYQASIAFSPVTDLTILRASPSVNSLRVLHKLTVSL